MMRKKKFIIVGVVLAALVILGTIGGIALAEDSVSPTTVADKFTAKVAAILNIDQATVQSAFDQARVEMRAEAQDTWLDQLVADGKITQAEADEYKAWLDARPAGLEQQGPRFGMMGRGFGRGFGGGGCFQFGTN